MTWHAANSVLTSSSFYQGIGKPKGIGFLETYVVWNQKQKERKYKFVESLIPALNKIISYAININS